MEDGSSTLIPGDPGACRDVFPWSGAWLLIFLAMAFLYGGACLAAAQIPSWYDGNRVHAHTRLPLTGRVLDYNDIEGAFARAKDLGARVLVRHIRSSGEHPEWLRPSSDGRQLLSLVEAGRSSEVKLIAYYWHMADHVLAREHPEWVCKDARGRPQKHRRGLYLDITGPFRDVVATSLMAAAQRGVEGFYFDHMHLPTGGCRGTSLEAEYRRRYGEAPPAATGSPMGLRWKQFSAARVAQTFEYWRSRVREVQPNALFIVSATYLPALTLPDTSTALISEVPAKTEYVNALRDRLGGRVFARYGGLAIPETDLRIAAGLAVMRDASDGLPPHVWSPGFPDERTALGFAASVIAHGGIANMDIPDRILLGRDGEEPERGKTPAEVLKKVFDLGNRVSPYMSGSRPLRWAAVHFSERARDSRWPDLHRAWSEILWPFIGAYGALLRSGVPVGVVNDSQLVMGELEGYSVLVLPAASDLSPEQQAAVSAFRRRRGIVIELNGQWHSRDAATQRALLEQIRRLLDAAPVRVLGGPKNMHAVAHVRKRSGHDELAVALTPDFSWIGTALADSLGGLRLAATGDIPKPVAAGVQVRVKDSTVGGSGPVYAHDAVSGRCLSVSRQGEHWGITAPAFDLLAVIVVARRALPCTRP